MMANLLEKYGAEGGHENLVRTLCLNFMVGGSVELAEDIANLAEVVATPAGSILIDEGGLDDDLHFVLTGELQVLVRDCEVAVLGAGSQVGELALVDPRALRSATVRALTDTVTAKVSEDSFVQLAGKHRALWRRMSQLLGNQLREGNRFVRRRNPRPHVFVASSPAGMPLARAIARVVSDSAHEVPTWLVETGCHEDASSLTTLAGSFTNSDFGVIVIAPGDTDISPGGEGSINRDALFFECGICMGAMGPQRTFLVQPHDLDQSAPSSTLGLAPLRYRLDPIEDLKTDLDTICDSIKTQIQNLHSR